MSYICIIDNKYDLHNIVLFDKNACVIKLFTNTSSVTVLTNMKNYKSSVNITVMTNKKKIINNEDYIVKNIILNDETCHFEFNFKQGTSNQNNRCIACYICITYVDTNNALSYILSPPIAMYTRNNNSIKRTFLADDIYSFLSIVNYTNLDEMLEKINNNLYYIIYHTHKIVTPNINSSIHNVIDCIKTNNFQAASEINNYSRICQIEFNIYNNQQRKDSIFSILTTQDGNKENYEFNMQQVRANAQKINAQQKKLNIIAHVKSKINIIEENTSIEKNTVVKIVTIANNVSIINSINNNVQNELMNDEIEAAEILFSLLNQSQNKKTKHV